MVSIEPLRVSSRWLVGIGEYELILSNQEITELAEALAFRLAVQRILAAGSGIVAQVGENSYVHLCFSAEAGILIGQIREAARDFPYTDLDGTVHSAEDA